MASINLRRYYPHYPKDKFIDVPDEVAAALEEGRLIENRQDHKRSYYHVYSMDCTPSIENHAMFLVLSPEELLIQEIDTVPFFLLGVYEKHGQPLEKVIRNILNVCFLRPKQRPYNTIH